MFSSKSDDPDAPSKCPSCGKDIGVEDNTYQFRVVDFTSEGAGGNQRNAGSKRWNAVAIIGELYKNGKSKEEMKSEKLGGLRETVGAVPPTRDDQKQCSTVTNPCKTVTDPCKTVTNPCKTVTNPCKTVTDPCKTVTNPCKTVTYLVRSA